MRHHSPSQCLRRHGGELSARPPDLICSVPDTQLRADEKTRGIVTLRSPRDQLICLGTVVATKTAFENRHRCKLLPQKATRSSKRPTIPLAWRSVNQPHMRQFSKSKPPPVDWPGIASACPRLPKSRTPRVSVDARGSRSWHSRRQRMRRSRRTWRTSEHSARHSPALPSAQDPVAQWIEERFPQPTRE